MLPIEAKRVFIHNVRPLLGGITRVKGGGDVGLPQIIVGTITEAPADQYDILVQKLYANIKYSTQEQPQFMPLARDEENAFKDLDMGHLLALEVRAFHVNFQRSYGVLLSEFPQLTVGFAAAQSDNLDMFFLGAYSSGACVPGSS